MRTKIKTRIIRLLLSVTLIIGVVACPLTSVPRARAAGEGYMKKLSLNWDLKKGKSLILTANYPGIGKRKYSVKVTTYQIQDASKEGYKKLTVAFQSTRKWAPKKKEVDKIINTSFIKMNKDHVYVPAVSAYTIADYDTGVSLEGKNDLGVTVKAFKDKVTGGKKYRASKKGDWISLWKTATRKFEITYPADYTGLCIGLLGTNAEYGKDFNVEDLSSTTGEDTDTAYFDATKYTKIKKNTYKEDENGTAFKFGQTSYYYKGKKNSHWMRVN